MKIETTYEHKNPLVRFYFNKKMEIVIKMAGLKKTDLILDFGCGPGQLEKVLRPEGYKIVGYDISPKETEIRDYRKLKPTKIIAMDVFEHMSKEELRKTIKNFKRMNPNFILITAVPTQNWLSRKLRRLIGKPEIAPDHITSLKEIESILKKELKVVKERGFFMLSKIFLLRNR